MNKKITLKELTVSAGLLTYACMSRFCFPEEVAQSLGSETARAGLKHFVTAVSYPIIIQSPNYFSELYHKKDCKFELYSSLIYLTTSFGWETAQAINKGFFQYEQFGLDMLGGLALIHYFKPELIKNCVSETKKHIAGFFKKNMEAVE